MDVLKKIPPAWAAVAVLIIIVLVLLFRQRRSGYTPPTGNVITMMDLQEFSAFSPEQKANYVNKLTAYQPRLSDALRTNSITNYQTILNEVMTNAMVQPTPPVPPPVPPAPKCRIGYFSTTGSEPGCMPCPVNTYCPNEGMTAPMNCPSGTTSNAAATVCMTIQPTPKVPPRTR
jgi:hypothetical protein